MPRSGLGVYSKPNASVLPNTTITSAEYNGTVDDIVADLNAPRPISAGGTGATSAGLARQALDVARQQSSLTDETEGRGVINGGHGLGGKAIDSTNWNDAAVTSFLKTNGSGVTGAPTSGSFIVCNHINFNVDRAAQIAIDTLDGGMWVRTKTGGTWASWKQVPARGITGTTSFDGSTVTGSIFESASDVTGGYIKYADGTMTCHRNALLLDGFTTQRLQGSWVFPEEFIDTNYSVTATLRPPLDTNGPGLVNSACTPRADELTAVVSGSKSGGSVVIQCYRIFGGTDFVSGDELYVDATAVGRWA